MLHNCQILIIVYLASLKTTLMLMPTVDELLCDDIVTEKLGKTVSHTANTSEALKGHVSAKLALMQNTVLICLCRSVVDPMSPV